jgi:Putative zinc-finger
MSSPRRHLDDLFSAAYEDELTPIEEARFQAHMQSCEPCATAYEEFRASIAALHELPKARMPHVVHLPSTAPVAEIPTRPRIGLSWFNLGLVRRFPATALAGAFVLVIAIAAVVHGSGSTVSGTGTDQPAQAIAPATGQHGGASTTAACSSVVGINGASPPPSFSQEDLATDPAQPALHLVLAAPTLTVTAGKQAIVYAQLTEPFTSLSIPGAVSTPAASRAALPCVSVTVAGTSSNSNSQLAVLPIFGAYQPAEPIPQAGGTSEGGSGSTRGSGLNGPLLSFQVPSGLAPGTELRVIATVPAGATGPNSPALTAELTLTIH